MTERKSWIDKLMGSFLGNEDRDFQEILIDREVVEEIIQIAREAHPLEFVALLEGKAHKGVLKIDGLIFLPGETSNQGAVMKVFMMPLSTGAVGSVHSHPIPSAAPSTADLHFFAKNGVFHLIIAEPYVEESIVAYNTFGEVIDYKVI